MLDTDQPQSAHIFAAFHQLGLIGQFAETMTLGTRKHRTDLYLIVEPAFAALRWLNENRFENCPRIADLISDLQMKLKQLAEMPHDETRDFESMECPVCGSEVTLAGTYRPHGAEFTVPAKRYCSRCLDTVIPAIEELQSVENGFGIEAI